MILLFIIQETHGVCVVHSDIDNFKWAVTEPYLWEWKRVYLLIIDVLEVLARAMREKKKKEKRNRKHPNWE